MPNINKLNLSDTELPGFNVDAMPQGLGIRVTPPQPGVYRFRLPESPAIENVFDTIETEDSQILVAAFNADSALYNVTLRQPYNARVTNRFREINRLNPETGEKEPMLISDFGMLLKAVDVTPDKVSNKYLATALASAAGREFIAEHTLTANCNPKKEIWVNGEQTKGKYGCGKNYGVEAWKGKKSEVPPKARNWFWRGWTSSAPLRTQSSEN
jgi:hypothetical protein